MNRSSNFIHSTGLIGLALIASDTLADPQSTSGTINAIQTNIRSAFDVGASHGLQAKRQSFGTDLRTWRNATGMTTADAARILDVEPEVITAYESNTFLPSDEILRQFEQAKRNRVTPPAK